MQNFGSSETFVFGVFFFLIRNGEKGELFKFITELEYHFPVLEKEIRK